MAYSLWVIGHMKPLTRLIPIVLASAFIGYSPSLIFSRDPIIEEITTVHFCSCIKEQPHLAPRLIQATKEVNSAIAEETDKYIKANGLKRGDLHATFYPLENGYSKIDFSCTNRNWKVRSRYDAYKKLISECDWPYRKIVHDAHDSYSDPEKEEVTESQN
jgi:hypothetical protein